MFCSLTFTIVLRDIEYLSFESLEVLPLTHPIWLKLSSIASEWLSKGYLSVSSLTLMNIRLNCTEKKFNIKNFFEVKCNWCKIIDTFEDIETKQLKVKIKILENYFQYKNSNEIS